MIRDGAKKLEYTSNLANPTDFLTKDLTDRFIDGIAQSYDHTPLKAGFVSSDVNEIERPNTRNAVSLRCLMFWYINHEQQLTEKLLSKLCSKRFLKPIGYFKVF